MPFSRLFFQLYDGGILIKYSMVAFCLFLDSDEKSLIGQVINGYRKAASTLYQWTVGL